MSFFDITLSILNRRRQNLLNLNYTPLIIEEKKGHAIIDTQHLANNEKTKKTNLDLEHGNNFDYKFTLQDYKAYDFSQSGDSFNVISGAAIGFEALNNYIDLTTFSSLHNLTSALDSKTPPAQVIFNPAAVTAAADNLTDTDISADTTTTVTPSSAPILKSEGIEREYFNLVNDLLVEEDAESEVSEEQDIHDEHMQPALRECEPATQGIAENYNLEAGSSEEYNVLEEEGAEPEDLPAARLNEADKREYLSLLNDLLDFEIKQDLRPVLHEDLIINQVNGTARFITKEQAMTAALREHRQKDISNPTSYNIEVYEDGRIIDAVVFTFEEVENIYRKLIHLNEMRQLKAYNDRLMQDYYKMREQMIAEEFNTGEFGDISNIDKLVDNNPEIESIEEPDVLDVPTGGDAAPEVSEEQALQEYMQQLLREEELATQDITENYNLRVEDSDESDEEDDEDSEYHALRNQYKKLQQQSEPATQDIAENNSLRVENTESSDILDVPTGGDAKPEELPAARLNEVDKGEYLSLVNDILDSEIKQDMQTPSHFINADQALLNEFMRPLLREDLINKVDGAARFITKEQAMAAALHEHRQKDISNPTAYNIEVYEDGRIIDAVVFTFEEVENIYSKLMHLNEMRQLKDYNDKLMQDYYEMQEQMIAISGLETLYHLETVA